MDEHLQTQNSSPELYQTGETAPPKTYSGIIAVLLVLVIFLAGVVSLLGLMNIHLFRALVHQQEDSAAMAFETAGAQARSEDWQVALYDDPQNTVTFGNRPTMGIIGQEITAFYAEHYGVPQGIYITQVDPASDAYAQGIRAGDILLRFESSPITEADALHAALDALNPGDRVSVCVYRKGREHTFRVTLSTLNQD